jgi:ribonucleoside-diphosphate reductase beta chain
MEEPLLCKNNNRFVLFPIKYQRVWEYYKHHEQAFWTAEEIDFASDISDWETLSYDEKTFIENILAFFAGSDGIVFENINNNFAKEIQVPEIRCYYGFQAMMENIHSEVYSMMIETYVKNNDRKTELFESINRMPAIKKKADWACQWLNSEIPFSERIVAFAIIEGIFFSGSFCSIFWLKNIKGKMTKALAKSNELIARDESLHTEFAIHLYTSYVVNKLSQERIHEMFTEAINIEKEFICDSLKCNLLGMNSLSMKEYIEFVSDRLLVQLGYTKLFNSKNPFSFMESICLDGKSNFFEQRVTEYNRAEQVNTSSEFKILSSF